jgi:hypothetical protein
MEDQGNEVSFSDRVSVSVGKITKFSLVDITLSDGDKFGFDDVVKWSKGDVQDLQPHQKDDLIRLFSEQLVAQVTSQHLIDSQLGR